MERAGTRNQDGGQEVIELRVYQTDLVNSARDLSRTLLMPTRIIIQLETGGGKTVLVLEPIRLAHERKKRVLFACRGRELVKQADAHLWEWGIPHGIIMAGEDTAPANIQLCSKDTLLSWVKRRQKIPMPEADLVIIDECHETYAKGWQWILEQYPNAVVLGLTATPVRADGRNLGDIWKGMVQGISTSKLIDGKWIVSTKVFAPYRPDLTGVPTSNGDYAQKPLAARMDKFDLVGDIVSHWKQLADNRRTIAYASSIDHALHICQEFIKEGVRAEHLDGTTELSERDAILKRLADGETTVVTSVGVLIQGVDLPSVSCAIDAQPTKSFGRARQKWGRIKRPFPGKEYAIVLDHAGNIYRHGHPDMDIDWQLDPGAKIQDKVAKQVQAAPPIVCPKCHAVFSGSRECPNCGLEMKRQPKERKSKGGQLVEVNGDGKSPHQFEQLKRYWHVCLGVMAHKGRTAGAACGMFKGKTGKLPWDVPGLLPMPSGPEWKSEVADLYPQFARRKA
jgi:DNA repair protein RadD